MKDILLIINPMAGRMRVRMELFNIIDMMNKEGFRVTVHMTQYRGHAGELAAEAGQYNRVVVAGGDGTFNEVIDGLQRARLQVPLGYIPCGSTNDFGSSLGLPKDIKAATAGVLGDQICPIDIGCFNGRYFSYIASFGAFTRASYETPQSVKNILGHAAYVLNGIKDLSTIKPERVRIEIEGKTYEDEYIMGAVTNSLSVGGLFTLDAKRVSMSDGKLEMLMVRFPKNPAQLNQIIQALLSQNYDSQMIQFCSAERMKIYANPSMPWTLDGERQEGQKEIEVVNVPGALQMLINSSRESIGRKE